MSNHVCGPSPSDDYEGRSAMRTLQEAHQIKANPSLHARAIKHAKREVSSLRKVAGSKPMKRGR